MKNITKLFVGAAGLFAASSLLAGPNENASLQATINAGVLTIVPGSVAGTHTPVGGAVTITGLLQEDALLFNINGVQINDLNGDGLGFVLTAAPDSNLVFGANNLPLGTVSGFNNPSDVANTTVDTANQITYGSGSGVAGYTIDYDVAYDVPALVDAGNYTGVIAFAVTAN